MATTLIHSATSSPLRVMEDQVDAVARSMMGPNSNAVSWDSLPLERSPSDPDVLAEMEARDLEKRIVYNPPVTYPTTGTVWTAGSKVQVKWTVSQKDIPADAKNYVGTVKLGYLPAGGDGGLNLHWTLANNFPITQEQIDVTLPADLGTRNDYIIVLMGDSGNRSKKFTINAKTAPVQTAPVQHNNDQTSQCNGQQPNAVPAPAPASVASARQPNTNVITEVASSLLGRDVPSV